MARSSASARVAVVGIGADRLGVFDDRAVVVLGAVRPPAPALEARRSSGAARREGQAAAPTAPTRRASVSGSAGPALDDIGSAGNLEREGLIGQSGVFLEIRESERRSAPLLVGGGQRARTKRLASAAAIQPVVVPLGFLGSRRQRQASGAPPLPEARR